MTISLGQQEARREECGQVQAVAVGSCCRPPAFKLLQRSRAAKDEGLLALVLLSEMFSGHSKINYHISNYRVLTDIWATLSWLDTVVSLYCTPEHGGGGGTVVCTALAVDQSGHAMSWRNGGGDRR